jgi:predicted HTH transcriptional regulator
VSAFLSSVPITDLAASHLDRLIADSVAESRDLEFKRDSLPPDNQAKPEVVRAAKREFLKDVTALANTFGGHLIIGIAEDSSVASEVVPVTDRSVDEEKQRLESLLRDAGEPRLIGVQMQQVAVTGGFVLMIRAPRSWNPPHRVLMGDHRFFGRNSSGAFPMDVEQLRGVFLGASEMDAAGP